MADYKNRCVEVNAGPNTVTLEHVGKADSTDTATRWTLFRFEADELLAQLVRKLDLDGLIVAGLEALAQEKNDKLNYEAQHYSEEDLEDIEAERVAALALAAKLEGK